MLCVNVERPRIGNDGLAMSETDRALKDRLNSNQVSRERMCLEILQIQSKFTDVRPRLPTGGPDGGRDIEATYNDELRVLGAVGFLNNATDTRQHRRQIRSKFLSDLKNLERIKQEKEERIPSVFVFFTNVGLAPALTNELKELSYAEGITICEIFDRERIRIALDAPTGYAIRFRYLDIALTDAEQKEFFFRFGGSIQELMASGVSRLESYTKRLTFLLEAQVPVDNLMLHVQLNSDLGEASGGDFLFQTMLMLRSHVDGLIQMTFGTCNEPVVETIEQIRATKPHFPRNGRIGFAFAHLLPGSAQYEAFREMYGVEDGDDEERWFRVLKSSGVSYLDKPLLRSEYSSEPFLMRWAPTCRLIDLDHASVLFDCNRAIANSIEKIILAANQYEILEIRKEDLRVEPGDFKRFRLPKEAHQTADFADWATLRPATGASCFNLHFTSRTPLRWLPFDT
jgi:hypothetical protein